MTFAGYQYPVTNHWQSCIAGADGRLRRADLYTQGPANCENSSLSAKYERFF